MKAVNEDTEIPLNKNRLELSDYLICLVHVLAILHLHQPLTKKKLLINYQITTIRRSNKSKQLKN